MYVHPRARVMKVGAEGWTAMIWPKTLVDGKRVGGLYSTAGAAKAACKKALPEHLQ